MLRVFRIWSPEILVVIACMTLAHAQAPVALGKAAESRGLQASADPLEVKLERTKVVLVDGKETRQSADFAKPGDLLEEVATYTNKSKAPIRRLEATLPIPPNTELVVASVKPGNAKASVDGSQFFALPLRRKMKQAKGFETEQLIPVGEYKYLRWYPGELGAEKSVVFSARFKVSTSGMPTVASDSK
jgi:hypothetical protein